MEKTERNLRLYEAWKSKKYRNQTALANKFHLSRQRVSQLIKKWKATEALIGGGTR